MAIVPLARLDGHYLHRVPVGSVVVDTTLPKALPLQKRGQALVNNCRYSFGHLTHAHLRFGCSFAHVKPQTRGWGWSPGFGRSCFLCPRRRDNGIGELDRKRFLHIARRVAAGFFGTTCPPVALACKPDSALCYEIIYVQSIDNPKAAKTTKETL
jgi:hypothetical protein